MSDTQAPIVAGMAPLLFDAALKLDHLNFGQLARVQNRAQNIAPELRLIDDLYLFECFRPRLLIHVG